MSLEIWTSGGKLRTNFSDEEIASLDGEKFERFSRLREAAMDLEQAEADLLAAQQSVEAWVKTRTAGLAELNRLKPPRTFMQEWAAMKASNQ
jgi:hypothetical protein